jgi:hypothetical protein
MSFWRKCSACKKEIPFLGAYQQCSISTCRKHNFCTVTCWDVHNGVMMHKSAWAEENHAPSENNEAGKPRRRIVGASSGSSKTIQSNSDIPKEVLIVASKLKQYVKAKHDLNTAGNVIEKLSDIIRYHCDEAVNKARSEGRKTLMDRDFE